MKLCSIFTSFHFDFKKFNIRVHYKALFNTFAYFTSDIVIFWVTYEVPIILFRIISLFKYLYVKDHPDHLNHLKLVIYHEAETYLFWKIFFSPKAKISSIIFIYDFYIWTYMFYVPPFSFNSTFLNKFIGSLLLIPLILLK